MADKNKLLQSMMGLSTQEPDLLSALLQQASRKFGPKDLLVSPQPALVPVATIGRSKKRKAKPAAKAAAPMPVVAPTPAPLPPDPQDALMEQALMSQIASLPAQEIGSFDVPTEEEQTPEVGSLGQYGVELVNERPPLDLPELKAEKPKEGDIEELRRLIRAYGEKKEDVNPLLLAATGAADILTGRDYLKEYWQPKKKAQEARQLEAIKQLYRVGELESGMSQMQLRAAGGLAGLEARMAMQEMAGDTRRQLKEQELAAKEAELARKREMEEMKLAFAKEQADKKAAATAEKQLQDIEFKMKKLEQDRALAEKRIATQAEIARRRAAGKGGPRPSGVQKEIERNVGKKLGDFDFLGKFAEGEKTIEKVEKMIETLDKNPKLLDQWFLGTIESEGGRALAGKLFGKGKETQQNIMIQRDSRSLIRLKEVLDSQFAAKEALRKEEELGIDIKMPWSMQRDKIKSAVEALKKQHRQVKRLAEHYRKYGNLDNAPSELLEAAENLPRDKDAIGGGGIGIGMPSATGEERSARQKRAEELRRSIEERKRKLGR